MGAEGQGQGLDRSVCDRLSGVAIRYDKWYGTDNTIIVAQIIGGNGIDNKW